MKNRTSITILQDINEAKHAKNTARLAPLIFDHVTICNGNDADDFEGIKKQILRAKYPIVVYPSENAKTLDSLVAQNREINHLILLDGTWRKAKRLWLRNTWLHELTCVKLTAQSNQYHMRRSPDAQSLSTVEAISISLNKLEGCSTAPAQEALSALNRHWYNYAPHNHNS